MGTRLQHNNMKLSKSILCYIVLLAEVISCAHVLCMVVMWTVIMQQSRTLKSVTIKSITNDIVRVHLAFDVVVNSIIIFINNSRVA